MLSCMPRSEYITGTICPHWVQFLKWETKLCIGCRVDERILDHVLIHFPRRNIFLFFFYSGGSNCAVSLNMPMSLTSMLEILKPLLSIITEVSLRHGAWPGTHVTQWDSKASQQVQWFGLLQVTVIMGGFSVTLCLLGAMKPLCYFNHG